MKIIPAGNRIRVTQGNRKFKKVYSNEFDNTRKGLREAINWAAEIDLGWSPAQDEDWKHASSARLG